MNIIVRLYWQHDLDLVALCMHPDFDMGKWMKKAVVAFAKGDAGFKIPLPRSMPYRVELDNCSTHFGLTPGKDDEIIACMNGFRYGQRNSAIKNIFRMYLETPYLDPYYNAETFAVKQRGSAKDSDTSAPKKQIVPVAPVVNASAVVAATKNVVKVIQEITPVSCVQANPPVVQEEPEPKENPILPQVVSSSVKESVEDSADDVLDESEDMGDEFDLFGALSEMIE